MQSIRLLALESIKRHSSSNGLYKGQVITNCVIDKVVKQIQVTQRMLTKQGE